VAIQATDLLLIERSGVKYSAPVSALPGATTITSGVSSVDFGAFPGASDCKTTITGQAGIVAGSKVKAYLIATATADHSADEHWVEPLAVMAGNIADGVGFDIYAANRGEGNGGSIHTRERGYGADGTMLYGEFTVAWEWI
jgi:hypothetical protein